MGKGLLIVTKPTSREVYRRWKHLDEQLSDAQYMAGPTAGFQSLLLYDLWQAVKAEMKDDS